MSSRKRYTLDTSNIFANSVPGIEKVDLLGLGGQGGDGEDHEACAQHLRHLGFQGGELVAQKGEKGEGHPFDPASGKMLCIRIIFFKFNRHHRMPKTF